MVSRYRRIYPDSYDATRQRSKMKLKYLRYVYLNLFTNTDLVFYKVYVFNMTERLFDPIEPTRFFFPRNPIFQTGLRGYKYESLSYEYGEIDDS